MVQLNPPLLIPFVKSNALHSGAVGLRRLQYALADEFLAVGLCFLQRGLDSCFLAKALL